MASDHRDVDPSDEFLALVADYLDDQIGLAELAAWLAEHINWLISGPNDNACELAQIAEFHLSEMSVFRSSDRLQRRE